MKATQDQTNALQATKFETARLPPSFLGITWQDWSPSRRSFAVVFPSFACVYFLLNTTQASRRAPDFQAGSRLAGFFMKVFVAAGPQLSRCQVLMLVAKLNKPRQNKMTTAWFIATKERILVCQTCLSSLKSGCARIN